MRALSLHRTVVTVLAASLLLGSSGCATNLVDRNALPTDAIAVQWWENEDARRRKEAAVAPGLESQSPSSNGVLDLSDYSSALRGQDGAEALRRYPGKLALINPRTRDVTFPDQAPPGARPLSWSADRTRLIFSSDRQSGKPQIYELNFASGEVRVLAPGRGNVLAGAFMGEAGVVFSTLNLDDAGELELLVAHSTPRQGDRVVEEGVAVQHLAASGDGQHVTFAARDLKMLASRPNHMPQLVVHDIASAAGRREVGPGLHPVFSPDGQWIVYSAGRPDALRTYRVRKEGTGRTAVGPSVRHEQTPAVSPDGNYVVYVSDHNGLGRLFVKRFDGSGDRLLYDGAAVEWPIW